MINLYAHASNISVNSMNIVLIPHYDMLRLWSLHESYPNGPFDVAS